VRKTFELLPHTVLRLELDFVKIDSWDREKAYIEVDGVRVWEQIFLYWEGDRNHCGDARFPEMAPLPLSLIAACARSGRRERLGTLWL